MVLRLCGEAMQIGDLVRIKATNSSYYGKVGIIVRSVPLTDTYYEIQIIGTNLRLHFTHSFIAKVRNGRGR